MTDSAPKAPEQKKVNSGDQTDSLGLSDKKSPWLMYALLQIPIVVIMLIVIYFLYEQSKM